MFHAIQKSTAFRETILTSRLESRIRLSLFSTDKRSNLHPAFVDVPVNPSDEDFSSEYNGNTLAKLIKLNSNRPGVDLNIESHFFQDGKITKEHFQNNEKTNK